MRENPATYTASMKTNKARNIVFREWSYFTPLKVSLATLVSF
jgi:hypothetical protein